MSKVKCHPSWEEVVQRAGEKEIDVLSALSRGSLYLPLSFISSTTAIQSWIYHLPKADMKSDGTRPNIRRLEVQFYHVPFLVSVLTDEPHVAARAHNIMRSNHNIERCGGMATTKTISAPGDTIALILQMALRVAMIQEFGSFPHLAQIYDIVPTANDYIVFNENEAAIPVSVLSFTAPTARSIIRQLAASCSMLQKKGFNHGSPRLENLSFHDMPFVYRYREHTVSGDILLRYHDLRTSSATFNGNHYFTASHKLDAHQNALHISPFQEVVNSNPACAYLDYKNLCGVNTLTYILSERTKDIYDSIRHGGVSLYSSSFDFYSFMMELMRVSSFRNAVFADEDLRTMWANMWISSADFDIMTERVHSGNLSFSNVNLRCDIADYILRITE
jgi:hypothetical protein